MAGPPAIVRALIDVLGATVATSMDQRLYRLDELIAPDVVGAALIAGEVHRALVRHWYAAFVAEEGLPETGTDLQADRALDAGGVWLWVDADGTPVSNAVRRPVVGGSSRVGPVYTPPALRGRGYASGATAAATRSILDEGAIPVLFTDLANPTSNKIYRAMGYRPVEDQLIVRLG